MFPSEAITSSSLDALLFYCSLLGILLFIGVILRLKVNIFKKLFIPASLIAGVIGLILGEWHRTFTNRNNPKLGSSARKAHNSCFRTHVNRNGASKY